MAQQGSSRKRSVKESVHLDFLREAMEWVVKQSTFQNLKTHGNISWIAKNLGAHLAVCSWHGVSGVGCERILPLPVWRPVV